MTKQTPYKLLMGFKPQVHNKFLPENIPSSTDCIQKLQETRQKVQKLLEALQTQKDMRKITEMKKGNQVWLEGKNLNVRGTHKLLPKQYRPFPIEEKIRTMAYHLNLLETMRIHNVFHINLLLPYKETEAYSPTFVQLPPDLIKGEKEYKIENIRDARRKPQGWGLQYLIYWKGYPVSNDSWVNYKDLHALELLKQYYDSATAGRENV